MHTFSATGLNDCGCQVARVDREGEVPTIYQRDPWEKLQPIVAKMPIDEIMRITGYSRRMAYAIKVGERNLLRSLSIYFYAPSK